MTKQSRITTQEIEREFNQSQGRKYGKWMLGKSETEDQPAFDNYVKSKLIHEECYTKSESDSKYQLAGAGPSPSGGGASITIPVNNDMVGSAIQGQYAVNLIDYRELSKDHRIGVGGKTSVQDPHQRLIYNLGKTTIDGLNSKYYAGAPLGMSGVKKSKELTLDGHWMEIAKGDSLRNEQGTLVIQVDHADSRGSQSEEKKITSDSVTISEKWTPNHYGFYKLALGSTNGAKKGHYSVHFQAYYGDFKPKGVRRDFQFAKFNNYELLSNGTDKDSYIKGKIFDQIEKKLDVVKLKDLNWHIGLTSLPLGLENFFVIECPDNMKLPKGDHEEDRQSKEIASKCLTNNLCEIPATDEQFHQHENRPYFAQQLAKFPVPDGTGKTVEKWCFVIVLDPTKVWNWIDLLTQTEVIYPVKEEITQKKIHVAAGGYVLNLTNGSKVQSNLYEKVADKGDGYEFSNSPFGFESIKVAKHQIVSVTPNYS